MKTIHCCTRWIVCGLMISLCNELSAQRAIIGASTEVRQNEWRETFTYRILDRDVLEPPKDVAERIEFEWQPATVDRLGNICTLRVQLTVNQQDGTPTPVDWDQKVSVFLAKTAGARPDWSAGVNNRTGLYHWAWVEQDGMVEVQFDLRRTELRPDDSRQLQVAVALARQEVNDEGLLEAVVSSRQPVLEQSIEMLEVPEPDQGVGRIIRLIEAASTWPDGEATAVDLIRAANALMQLERDEALAALEEYTEMVSGPGNRFTDCYVIYALIQCAFEPASHSDHLPAPQLHRSLGSQQAAGSAVWPREPMAFAADIPFLIGTPYGLIRNPSHPRSDLIWLRRFGVLRDEPLRPADNPLAAAEALLNDPRIPQLDPKIRRDTIQAIKRQSYAMIAEFLTPIPQDHRGRSSVEDHWHSLLRQVESLPLRWDEELQQYILH